MEAQQPREKLQKLVSVRKPINLRDRKNRPIYTGDVVRFYYDAEVGVSEEQAYYGSQEVYTEMNSLVCEFNGHSYFGSLLNSSLPNFFTAFRYAEYCEVIGHGIDFFLLVNKEEVEA